ncbi:unnamed protein product [Didymodactylos carnosus]|uniref:Uncharacterized protein n=1 Tax=Didymodactylos carnosus TaxID=1234261 RepID=A0A8S2P4F6_9BILA|nr:unnamed protein product [Didymodactylos carnosus]CAF4031756.1 unnamed protein product [Didymodactylos carnosus]
MIVFDITDDENKCVQNLTYWLEFLRVRILIREPIGLNGQSSEMVKIILVGTHADQILNCPKDENGDYVCEKATIVFNRIKDNYQYDFDFHDKLYLLDARSAWTSNIKNVIQCFNSYKDKICEKLKPSTMFLNRCTYHLQQWRKTYASFPVMSWSRFVENIRTELNPLASDEHMKELVQQLQLMGEILYLEGDPHQDLVCFDPHWLCHTILGKLLTSNYDIKKNILNNINKVKSKQQRFLNGTYSINDIQTLFPDTDALDLLQIFCAFDLCVQYDVYGDIEYEFPQLNSVDIIPGLWEKRSGVNYVYIGCEIRCRTNNELLWPIFSRIQVQLRRLTMSHEFQQQYKNEDIELYQSRCGSKLICGMIELLFTANHPTHLELKSRGQPNERENIFYLFHEILTLIEQTYLHTCPSLQLEYHYISTKHLQLNLTPLLNLFYQNSEVISKRPLQMSTSSIFITDQNLPSPTMSTYSLPFASNNNDTIFNTINQFTSPFYYTFSPKSIIQIQMNKSHEDNSIQPVTDANNNRKSILNDHHQIESPDDDSSSLLIKDTTGEYQEDLIDLICCGSYDLYSNLEMGVDLSISTLSLVTRQLLCRLFDKQDSMGRDWCLLAIALSMQHLIPLLDTEDLYKSKTEQLLDELCRKRSTDANIKYLLEKFLDIDRKDAYDLVAYTCPLFKLPQIQPVTDQITDPHDSHDSGIQNSTNTIASINR